MGQEDPHFCSTCLGGWGLLTELEGTCRGPRGESWVCSCHTLPPTASPPTGRLRATTPHSAERTQTWGSGVPLINSSGTVLGSLMVLKCLITNFRVTVRLKSPGGGIAGLILACLASEHLVSGPGGEGSRESWWNGVGVSPGHGGLACRPGGGGVRPWTRLQDVQRQVPIWGSRRVCEAGLTPPVPPTSGRCSCEDRSPARLRAPRAARASRLLLGFFPVKSGRT